MFASYREIARQPRRPDVMGVLVGLYNGISRWRLLGEIGKSLAACQAKFVSLASGARTLQ